VATREAGTAAPHSPARKLRSIEGVRGLAAASILVYHVEREMNGDTGRLTPSFLDAVVTHMWLGVPAFFVLSGFLLYRPFVASTIFGDKWPSVQRYSRARVLRIFPAYWFAATAVLCVYGDLMPALLVIAGLGISIAVSRGRASESVLLGASVAVIAVVMAIFTVLRLAPDPTAFLAFHARQYLLLENWFGNNFVVGPAWTLAIEITFYAALPILAALIHTAARHRSTFAARITVTAACLFCLVPIGIGYQTLADEGERLPVVLPGYLDQFAVGMGLALVYECISRRSRREHALFSAPALTIFAFVALGFATVVRDIGPAAAKTNGSSVFYQPLMALAFAFLIASAVVDSHGSFPSGPLPSSASSRTASFSGTSRSSTRWVRPASCWIPSSRTCCCSRL
jgi:peptidoglycan/LPS O-acetylase OafA/YrhL